MGSALFPDLQQAFRHSAPSFHANPLQAFLNCVIDSRGHALSGQARQFARAAMGFFVFDV
jgi:hypothetical protein